MIDADPLMLIDCAVAGGFDGIGLRIVPPMPSDTIVPVVGDEPLIRALGQKLDDTGVRILDVEAVWLMPHTDVAGLEPALAVAARLGARHVLTVGNDPDAARLQANFGALCALAGRYGLRVMLEPISYVALRTLAEARALIAKAGQGNAGLLIDALHLVRAGGTAADIRACPPELLSYWHLCDAPLLSPDPANLRAEGRGGRLFPGEGQLPLAEMLAAFPPGTPIGVEAPTAVHAHLPPIERAKLCGKKVRDVVSHLPFV